MKFHKKKLTRKLYKQQAMDKKKEKENRELEKGTLEMKTKIKK